MGTESALISKGLTKVMATASAKGSRRRQATKLTAVAALAMLRSTCQPIRRVPRVRIPPWAIASATAKKGRGNAGEEHDLGQGIAPDELLGGGVDHRHAEDAEAHIDQAPEGEAAPDMPGFGQAAHPAALRRARASMASRRAI